MKLRLTLLLVLLAAMAAPAAAQPAYLVKDLAPQAEPHGSFPGGYAPIDSGVCFFAYTEPERTALWRTDGTETGTVRVARVADPTGGLTRLGPWLVFTASDNTHGNELWRTDCTAEGTTLLKDINPGPDGSDPWAFVVVNGEVFFFARSGALQQLWKTDGTATGTRPLAQVPLWAAELSYAAGHFFFVAEDAAHGRELWTSDGTDAGTALLKDVRPGVVSAMPTLGETQFGSYLYPAGDRLFFAADDGVHGMELWRSDGTADGTTLVADIVPGPGGGVDVINTRWMASGGVLYFLAHGGGLGVEPWRSDGTVTGTGILADLAPGPDGSTSWGFSVFGDRVLFSVGGTRGRGIWITDGSGPGTVLFQQVEELFPKFSILGDSLFFIDVAEGGLGLYKKERTGGDATLIKPGQSSVVAVVAGPDGLLFGGDDPVTGNELWRTDGTRSGTRLLRNINPDVASGIDRFSTELRSFNGALLVSTYSNEGHVVFRSDGTVAGTQRFGNDCFYGRGTEFNGRLICGNWDGVVSTDGTAAGTVQLAADLSLQNDFAILNGRLFFTAYRWSQDLWRTDGTPAGTVQITGGALGTYPSNLTIVNGALYYLAWGPEADSAGYYVQGLWRTDGTTAGTTRIALIGSAPLTRRLANVNGTLFFTGGGGLWKSDCTATGTGLLKSIPGELLALTNMDGTLMFVADDGVHGRELWRSDGTEAGTVLVRDISDGPRSALNRYPEPSLSVLGHQVIFAADDQTHGLEPWRSDGTAAGTLLLKDIAPGAASSDAQSLTAIDGTVLFTADDGIHGYELWRSDGTGAGTALLQDIAPGPASSRPQNFTAAGPHIFFTAHTPDHGRELWAINRAAEFYPCTVGVVNPTLSIGANGGGRRIGITATSGCGWTVTTGSPWATVVAGSAGSGDGGATVSIARNTTGSSRTLTLQVSALTVTVRQSARNRAVASDFDGDTRGDVSVWRPATGDWWSLRSIPGGSHLRTPWGAAGDVAVPGDYDGDGASDVAVFRPSNGRWYVKDGATVEWGGAGDIPVPGDYDGDGVTDMAVFSPGKGLFLVRGGGTIAWGVAGDIPAPADYDGDGVTDIAVFRPSTGTWYIRDLKSAVWGAAGDVPVAADYDGDGAADIAVFRPSSGVWYVMDRFTARWGAAGDIPVPIDRDGDGVAELGLFRRATGTWYFQNRLTAGIETVVWGAAGDVPLGRIPSPPMTITGDVDGDRTADLAVYRPSSAEWRALRSLSGGTDSIDRTFGMSGDTTVSRDYDGDGKTDFALFRPSTGWWYVLHSSTNWTEFTAQSWGLSGDIPVPGDYDGDGKADVAVFRPSTGRWVIRLSSADDNSYAAYDFGLTGDIPVPADYDGDGRIDVAVFRPSIGRWYIFDRTTGTSQSIDWGLDGDVAVPADFDGDAKADLTVFRPSLGRWFVKSSIDGTYRVADWGLSGDVMVPADFNGDGKADIAVFRPSNATWYVRDQFNRSWNAVGDTPAMRFP